MEESGPACKSAAPACADVTSLHPKLVSRWWLGLEGFVPPPVGAFTGRPLAGRYRWWGLCGWSGQRGIGQGVAVGVGDVELVRGPDEGDAPGVVQAMMVRTDQTGRQRNRDETGLDCVEEAS